MMDIKQVILLLLLPKQKFREIVNYEYSDY